MEVVCVEEFSLVCENCGGRHWHFFNSVEDRERWLSWLDRPKHSVVKLVTPPKDKK
jgi:hypothetical protein